MKKSKKDVIKNISVKPDNELIVWEKWVQTRQKDTQMLSKSLNRPAVDLTMNLLEKERKEKEEKTVLELAQIEKKSKIRGGLWEQPLRLKQTCACEPVYEVCRTAAELGHAKVIQHIGVPHSIQETEKGMTGVSERVNCEKLNSEYTKYRTKREEDLKVKIKKIDPFRSKIDGLIVKGNKPKPPPPKVPDLPTLTISTPDSLLHEVQSDIYALRINNTVLYKDSPGKSLDFVKKFQKESWHENCTTWHYYINVPIKRVGRSKLLLQNLGTVTLRYCWRAINKSIPYIPEEVYDQVFFFNKNEDVLSPGQSRHLQFTFASSQPGMYSELWELSFCNINFFDTLNEKLCIHLKADAVEDIDETKKKIKTFKKELDRQALINFLNDFLGEIVSKSTEVAPQNYPYKYRLLEADMFVMKNPVCFYHQTEVSKMKEIYKEMLSSEVWDLSITSWREIMMKKKYEDRMKYFEILKQSHSELLKPWYEGEDVQEQKYRAVRLLLGQMADKFDKEYNNLCRTWALSIENAIEGEVLPIPQKVHNTFYLYAYECLAVTMELCAGVISSIDLNRWIKFDFCRL